MSRAVIFSGNIKRGEEREGRRVIRMMSELRFDCPKEKERERGRSLASLYCMHFFNCFYRTLHAFLHQHGGHHTALCRAAVQKYEDGG